MIVLKSDGILEAETLSSIKENLGEDLEFIREGNLAFLIFTERLSPLKEDGKPSWKEIAISEIKNGIRKIKKMGAMALKESGLLKTDYVPLDTFDIIVGGAPRDYWIEAQMDVDAFRIGAGGAASLSDMTSTVRIALLNNELFSSPAILGNNMDAHRLAPNIFSFMPKVKKGSGESSLPKMYLIEYEANEEGSFAKEEDEGPGEHMAKEFISTFIRFIGLHLNFISLYKKDYPEYQKSAPRIRKSIQKLNRTIDSLLRGTPTSKKEKKGDGGGEVALLHTASVCFTNLMELDENLSNNIMYLNDAMSSVERIEADLGTTKIEESAGSNLAINSLIQHLQTMRNTIIFAFTNLRENIENSQTRLRNTVDSYKTYQENRRRATSEKSEKTFNTVFILLAILTIGDAVGNFLVYAREEGDWLGAVLGFSGVLVVLISVFAIVYFLVLRGMFMDS